MKLVSTKRSPKELKTSTKCEPYSPDPYPYSTRLSLDKNVLDKLDISPKDFKVGQKVTVQALAVVKSLRMVEGKDYDTNEVELQIQEIGIDKSAGSLKEAVEDGVKEASK